MRKKDILNKTLRLDENFILYNENNQSLNNEMDLFTFNKILFSLFSNEVKDFKTKEFKHFENFKLYFKQNTDYIIESFNYNNEKYIKIIKQ